MKDLNWDQMRQSLLHESQFRKTPQDWDSKAVSFSKRTPASCYAEKFIQLLSPTKEWSVLDVGCGPGTISLPLSPLVKHITAVDFSPGMLEILQNRSQNLKYNNISPQLLSWDDDWQKKHITRHDITIASRSLAVRNLQTALAKLTAFAKKGVYITDRVGTGPHDPFAFKAIGRTIPDHPDYIYTINLLYQMGHHAEVRFIRLENTLYCSSPDEALEAFSWMFKDLSTKERKLLQQYVNSITKKSNNGSYVVQKQYYPIWAFIYWPTKQNVSR